MATADPTTEVPVQVAPKRRGRPPRKGIELAQASGASADGSPTHIGGLRHELEVTESLVETLRAESPTTVQAILGHLAKEFPPARRRGRPPAKG